MKNSRRQNKIPEVSLINRLKGIEKRIWGLEDKIETGSSSKGNVTIFKISVQQNIQEMWDTYEKPNSMNNEYRGWNEKKKT